MHNVYHLLVRVLPGGVEGAVVELGSRVGWSAILLRRILDFIDPPRELHVYDAFELGFEPPSDADEGLARGVLFEQPAGVFHAGAEVLLGNFAMCRLAPPIVHAGGFRETLPDELPDRIAFADLDSDLYESILQGLEGVYPLLVPGAVVLIDDCGGLVPEWPNRFPGVLRAWTDYLVSRPEALRPLYGGGADPQAFFTRGTLDH